MARSLNGSSDFIQMGGVVRGNDLLGVMVACWVKPATLGVPMKVMARWDTGVSEQWLLAINPDGTVIVATLDASSSGHATSSTAAIAAGVWSHIGLICANNTTLQAYVNGAASGPSIDPGVLNQSAVETQPVFIGKSAAGDFYDGEIAEAMISLVNTNLAPIPTYEKVMAQLAAGVGVYEATSVTQTSELIRYYALLGDSPEPDYSGHAVTSTLTGTTVASGPPARTLTLGLTGATA
jgi:hypothetical protein